jgi:hypothetical protein
MVDIQSVSDDDAAQKQLASVNPDASTVLGLESIKLLNNQVRTAVHDFANDPVGNFYGAFSCLGRYGSEHPKTVAAAAACAGATLLTDGLAFGLGPECMTGAEMGLALTGELPSTIRKELTGKASSEGINLNFRNRSDINDQSVELLADLLKATTVASIDVRNTKLTPAGVQKLTDLIKGRHRGIMVISD